MIGYNNEVGLAVAVRLQAPEVGRVDILLIAFVIYFVVLVTVLVLQRVLQKAASHRAARRRPGADPTGDGFAPDGAWDELDTYIARSHGGHPLQ